MTLSDRGTWCATAALLIVVIKIGLSEFQGILETGSKGTGRILSAVSASMATQATKSISIHQQYPEYLKAKHDVNSVSITVRNEYTTVGKTRFDYPFLRDAHLLEPYRESTVSVSGLSAECGVNWRFDAVAGSPKGAAASGFSDTADRINVTPKFTGKYTLTLQQECSGTFAQFTVWIKYVRRELSTLTDADREEFLDAMHVLWTTSTEEGKKLYGNRYKSINYLTTIHSDAGANGYCDQFHGDTGFVNSHVYLGAYMEQSLQLVNPRVALHYMEYSKYFMTSAFSEVHLKNQMDGGEWSEFFTDKWFGTSDPISGRIINSRWANLESPFLDNSFFEEEGIDKNALFFPENADTWYFFTEYPHVFSPYGYLRSPWNYNPDKYYARYHNIDRIEDASSLVGTVFETKYNGLFCEQIVEFIDSLSGSPLESLLTLLESAPHNSAHFTFAGVGGDVQADNDKKFRDKFGFTDEDILWTTFAMQIYRKRAFTSWNQHPESIMMFSPWPYNFTLGAYTVDELIPPGKEGGTNAHITAPYLENNEAMNEVIEEIFPSSYAEEFGADTAAAKLYALDDDSKREALQLLAERFQYDGELATSTAALDPVFWVLHGTLERLYQKIIFEGILSDMTWTTESDCAGHNPGSTRFWLTGLFLQDPTIKVEELTNLQLLNILDPRGDDFANLMNFVYDSNQWEWCDNFESYFESA